MAARRCGGSSAGAPAGGRRVPAPRASAERRRLHRAAGAPARRTRFRRAAGAPARRTRLRRAAGALSALLAWALAACGAPEGEATPTVPLGATTTLEDSGLLDALLAGYRAAHPGSPVRALTGGTGEVLALGRRGDVDVVITHDPAAESLFVAQGHGEARRPLARSELIVAGPPADPAGVADAPDAATAFARIAAARAPFVSRADDSGTHRKERLVWSRALAGGAGTRVEGEPRPGVDRPPADARWYAQAGVGMGDALRVAGQRGAYILVDRPTFVMLRREHGLAELLRGDPLLENPYGVMVVAGSARAPAARALAAWLTGDGGQDVIRAFGTDSAGAALFVTPEEASP